MLLLNLSYPTSSFGDPRKSTENTTVDQRSAKFFFIKGQRVNILCFVGQTVTIMTLLLGHNRDNVSLDDGAVCQ